MESRIGGEGDPLHAENPVCVVGPEEAVSGYLYVMYVLWI